MQDNLLRAVRESKEADHIRRSFERPVPEISALTKLVPFFCQGLPTVDNLRNFFLTLISEGLSAYAKSAIRFEGDSRMGLDTGNGRCPIVLRVYPSRRQ